MHTPHPALQPDSWIGCWNQLSRHVRRQLGERYSAANLSESTAAILEALASARFSPTQSDLARELNFSESNLCGLIERMRREGLLQRERSWKDRRKSVLTLTATGEEQCQLIHRIHKDLTEQLLSGLSAEQRDEISALLSELLRHQTVTDETFTSHRRAAS